MATLPDLYQILGVRRDASDEEIKRRYRQLARELHPDVNRDPDAERRFKEITAAYQTLADPGRRRQYDLFGGQGGTVAPDLFPFGDVGEIFDVFFGGAFGRRPGGRRRTRTQRGEDLYIELALSFEEAVFGVSTEVMLETFDACSRCAGSGCEPGTYPSRCAKCGGAGEVQDVSRSLFGTVMTARTCTVCEGTGEEIAAPCTQCHGQGRVPVRRATTVEVPAGVSEGMELRVTSAGQGGRQGGAPGDLYAALRVAPHPTFDRQGENLICELPVPMTLAAMGGDVEISTLDGTERIRVEPGTESGTVIRLRGKGVPHLGRRGRGDLFVSVAVQTPKAGSREERALIERLAELRGEAQEKGKPVAGRPRKPRER
jgi:molecular chaperone DnaJ